MKKVVQFLLCLLLFTSCGSIKKNVKEDVEHTMNVVSSTTEQSVVTDSTSSESTVTKVTTTTEQTNDSSETIIIRETIWYDTSKADSNGVAPVLMKENVTSITSNGRKTTKDCEDQSESEEKKKSSTTIQSSANKEESAESAYKSKKQSDTSATETKQLQYLSWVLPGIAFVIIAAILAYWVFTKYRQRNWNI